MTDKRILLGTVLISSAISLTLAARMISRMPKPPQEPPKRQAPAAARIICMAPNIVETVFALGAGERVVGVSEYTVWPPEAKAKPQVGALFNPNLERIVSLNPDLVIIQDRHEKVEDLCRVRGIRALIVHMDNLAGIRDGITAIGAELGLTESARALNQRIAADLDEVRRKHADKPRVKVFLSLGHSAGELRSLFSVGRTAFLSELIGVAGGENIFDDIEKPFPQVSVETLVARQPEVIVETFPGDPMPAERREQLTRDWQALSTLPAVRDGRVVILTEDYLQLPGPRVGLVAARLAEAIHGGGANAP